MRKRILIVDDSESIRHFLRSLLEEEGCEVRDAETGEAGLALLGEFDPEVAVIDVLLPGMDGFQLLGEIKQRSPDTEVLVMSSHDSFERADRAMSQGAFGYIVKPFEEIEEIWMKIQSALERRQLAREGGAPQAEQGQHTS